MLFLFVVDNWTITITVSHVWLKQNVKTIASFVAAISIGFNMEAYTFIGLASASFYPDIITLVNNDGVVSEQALLSRLQLLMLTMI